MNRRLSTLSVFFLALAMLATAGCTGLSLTGLPEGSADFGDTVTVRYTILADNGTALRPERTATFVLGSGSSGLGLGFERNLRGHMAGDNLTFTVKDDPSLGFSKTVEVDRHLDSDPTTEEIEGILQKQHAPRRDYEANVGPAFVGQTFPAFGIYTATVTGLTADQVNFTIAADPMQRDPVPSVGAILVSDPDGTYIQRTLEPDVGKTFTINPPSMGGSTPLGLTPGTYKTLGATDDKIQYGYSTSGSLDLVGQDVRFKATIVRLVPGNHAIEPACNDDGEDCNYAVRPSPYVNGDPDSVLVAMHEGDETSDGHGH